HSFRRPGLITPARPTYSALQPSDDGWPDGDLVGHSTCGCREGAYTQHGDWEEPSTMNPNWTVTSGWLAILVAALAAASLMWLARNWAFVTGARWAIAFGPALRRVVAEPAAPGRGRPASPGAFARPAAPGGL